MGKYLDEETKDKVVSLVKDRLDLKSQKENLKKQLAQIELSLRGLTLDRIASKAKVHYDTAWKTERKILNARN